MKPQVSLQHVLMAQCIRSIFTEPSRKQTICCIRKFSPALAIYLCKHSLKRINITSSALSDKSRTIREGHISFKQISVKEPSFKPSSRIINLNLGGQTRTLNRNQVFCAKSEENFLPNISLISLHAVSCRLSCCLVGRTPHASPTQVFCTERANVSLARPHVRRALQDRPSISICWQFSCLNFRSGQTGAAHSSAVQWFCAAPAENHFAKPSLDLSISVSSLPSLVPLGVDGRRAFKRNSMFSRRNCGELLCKASLRSFYMLPVLVCLNFRSGWTGVAHSSATQCCRAAPTEHCFAKSPLDRPICCKVSSVVISAWGGRGPRIQAQLNVFAPPLRRIALQRLP